jgi:hypothetical protein
MNRDLKMVFGAPKSSYDPKSGAMILGSIGESAVFPAARTLLGRGVLSKREKNEPGRQLRISEAFVTFLLI